MYRSWLALVGFVVIFDCHTLEIPFTLVGAVMSLMLLL